MAESKRDASCIFCKIVAGEIPALTVYQDDQVLAFLDVGPLSIGHTLIIPKAHYATLDEMPDEDAAACMRVAPRLSRALRDATGMSAWNVLQNNGRAAHQAVDHVHFHIIPKTDTGGLPIDWPAGELDKQEGEQLCKQIVSAMEGR